MSIISQGTAATRLRCGGMFNDDVITNSLQSPKVQELLILADIRQS